MDSVLDFDQQEIKAIKATLSQHKETYLAYAPQLIEDALNLLLSTGAKPESFNLLKSISESEQGESISEVLNIILAICSQIFRAGVQSQEELALIVEDMGLRSKGAEVMKVF